MRKQFFIEYGQWFPLQSSDQRRQAFIDSGVAQTHWVQPNFCRAVPKFCSRTQGLFKEEFRGTGIVALNWKTFVCWDETSGETKCSAKGINKRLNDLQAQIYEDVLEKKATFTGTNRGFIQKHPAIHTYSQQRNSITYINTKCKVHADGINTILERIGFWRQLIPKLPLCHP